MEERTELIERFFTKLTGHLAWIQKHPVKKNEVICSMIDDEFEIRSYSDGALSLDRKNYVTHHGFVNSIDDVGILLDSFLQAHGLEGIKAEDL